MILDDSKCFLFATQTNIAIFFVKKKCSLTVAPTYFFRKMNSYIVFYNVVYDFFVFRN